MQRYAETHPAALAAPVPRGDGESICLLIEDVRGELEHMDNVPEHPGRNFGLVPVVGNRIMDFPAINVGIFPSPHSRSMLGGDRLERFRPWFREGDVPGSQMWQRAFPMGELAL